MIPKAPPKVGILLFDGVEVLDFAGPLEVFSCAIGTEGEALFRAYTVASAQAVLCVGGLKAIPHYNLAEAPLPDIMVVPGGPGAREPLDPVPVLDYLKELWASVQVMSSVCTGAYWLARAGILSGLSATTHPLRLDEFAMSFPEVKAVRKKIVAQDRVITAGGVASGVDLALYILEKYYGPQARQRECVRLDGPWQ